MAGNVTLALALVLACSGPSTQDDITRDATSATGDTGPEPCCDSTSGADLGAVAGPAPLVAAVLRVQVDAPGTWRVEYGEEALDHATPEVHGNALHVRGLKANTTYRWRVVGTDDEGNARVSAEQSYLVPPAPAVFPTFTLQTEGEPGFEYIVLTVLIDPPVNRSAIVILDKKGTPVWWVLGDAGMSFVTPQITTEDGELVVGWVQTDNAMEEDLGMLVHVPMSGAWRRETRLVMGHHDVVEHPDGTLAFLAHTTKSAIVVPEILEFMSSQIRIGRVGQGEGDETMLLFDHFADFPERPEVLCPHIGLTALRLGFQDIHEWTHSNSFMYIPEDNLYLVNDKFTDWLFAVDATSGDLRWIMNGPGSNFTNPNGTPIWTSVEDTTLWSHAHMSDAWSGGVMVFDNGDHRDPPYSRVMEVSWDDQAMTAEPVWIHDHPERGFTHALGDAKKLADDRVLITWAAIGSVEVVRRDHTTDWRIDVSRDAFVGRVLPLQSLY